MNRPFFSAQDFGATGDGKTLDTEFLQRAIDACHTAGGGTVYFSPGIYLTGTLHLKTGVRLYLEAGATILGSTREEDYVPCALREIAGETVSLGCSLIDGADAEDVAIEGRGVIDGSGRAFWKEEMVNAYVRAPKEWRPRALIYLANCRRLRFRDITLRNSPCYTLWLLGCDDAVIDGLTIDNPYDGPNTDALDIDCCRDVRIANCAISAGDDCIALKSDAARLGEDRPCERITVTNCTFSSSACAIRIGYEGDAWIRQCVFSNITIFHTHRV